MLDTRSELPEEADLLGETPSPDPQPIEKTKLGATNRSRSQDRPVSKRTPGGRGKSMERSGKVFASLSQEKSQVTASPEMPIGD